MEVKRRLSLFKELIYLFWLCWVFIDAYGFSLVSESVFTEVHRVLVAWLLLLLSTGSGQGLAACEHSGCSPRALEVCPLHWQLDSQPLDHQFFNMRKISEHILCQELSSREGTDIERKRWKRNCWGNVP